MEACVEGRAELVPVEKAGEAVGEAVVAARAACMGSCHRCYHCWELMEETVVQ